VILDEYVKNRDVWRCPSAKVEYAASFILPGPDFLQALKTSEGSWGQVGDWNFGFGICMRTFPPGWGGAVTDSIVQQRLGGPNAGFASVEQTAQKAFVASIGTNYGVTDGRGLHTGAKLAAVEDPVKYVACADCGVVDYVGEVTKLAYPELCCVECSWFLTSEADRAADPDWYVPGCVEYHASPDWAADPARKKMSTRHLGGVNVGFLDGHASWINSTALLNRYLEDDIDGVGTQCIGFTREMASAYCGFDWGADYPFLP
jgi:prepilin-type processing-associated H-X9-DG protein